MPINSRSSTVSRRNEILTAINTDGQVYVDELSSRFGVSEVTIRNDLDQLEQKNLLIRARGGAMRIEGRVGVDYNLSEKDKLNYHEKMKIGKAAAKLIHDSETVLIDSGTATAEMVKNLPNMEELTVITNALNIATLLMGNPGVNLTIPGGFLRRKSQSLVGPMAQRNLKNFYVDKAFLGVDGFDTKTGIYTPNIEEAHLNELMIEIANEVILLSDSSKFKKKSFAFICPVDKIDVVVTDDKIDPEDYRRLEDAGVKVIIA